MEKSKLVKANEKIAETVVGGYKKIEEGVVGGYKQIEDGVVGGFTKMTDKFVGQFLRHEGEPMEDAKKRMADEQAEREAAGIGKSSVEASLETARASVEASKNAGKHH